MVASGSFRAGMTIVSNSTMAVVCCETWGGQDPSLKPGPALIYL